MVAQTTCILCGQPRILSKTWSELIGISKVTYSQSVCPDTECQKIVEKQLKDKHDAFFQRNEDSLKRRKENFIKRTLLRKSQNIAKKIQEALVKS